MENTTNSQFRSPTDWNRFAFQQKRLEFLLGLAFLILADQFPDVLTWSAAAAFSLLLNESLQFLRHGHVH